MYRTITLTISLILAFSLSPIQQKLNAAICLDSITQKKLTPFYWKPISDVDKVLQHENMKQLNKKALDKVNKYGNEYYKSGVNKMKNKEYTVAIQELQNAMKQYKRAKLSDDAYNYIYTNLALCFISTGKNKDKVMAKRYVNLLTKTILKEKTWVYNIAIVQYNLNNKEEAASMLTSCIKMDEYYYQAYETLKAIYNEAGNTKSANKVHEQMQSAQAEELEEQQKQRNPGKNKKSKKKGDVRVASSGKEPDIHNLNIVGNDDHLQFNKVSDINERSMEQIQKGVGYYNDGVKALRNKEYDKAISDLRNAEKKLKAGKIKEDGLNFVRANLIIAYLSKGDKRGKGQAKRYFKYITKKIYKTRDWTYNMGVAYYKFGDQDKALDLFKLATKQDKLYLDPYQNMIFIYNKSEDSKKALSAQNSHDKYRNELIESFSRKDQAKYNVADPYVFRIYLGTYGEYNTPPDIYNENCLISVPMNEETTTYLAGIFFSMEKAEDYQKTMQKKGYKDAYVVGYRDGKEFKW